MFLESGQKSIQVVDNMHSKYVRSHRNTYIYIHRLVEIACTYVSF